MKSPITRMKRQWTYLVRHGMTQAQAYKWIFGYDPVTQWQ
jgi:hypothetical protein